MTQQDKKRCYLCGEYFVPYMRSFGTEKHPFFDYSSECAKCEKKRAEIESERIKFKSFVSGIERDAALKKLSQLNLEKHKSEMLILRGQIAKDLLDELLRKGRR